MGREPPPGYPAQLSPLGPAPPELRNLLQVPQHVGRGEQHSRGVGDVPPDRLGKGVAGTLQEEQKDPCRAPSTSAGPDRPEGGGAGGAPRPSLMLTISNTAKSAL